MMAEKFGRILAKIIGPLFPAWWRGFAEGWRSEREKNH